MEFDRRKAKVMAAISDPRPDKSPKGTLDLPIIPLINTINLHPSYFTTSSCSGRITILSHHPTVTTTDSDQGDTNKSNSNGSDSDEKSNRKKKAGGGGWLLVSHEAVDPEAVVDLLFGEREQHSGGGSLVFRFEPLIIAVECKDVAAAQLLVATAISSGFRESGITSAHKRIMVAVRCSIRMEVPLGETDSVLVSPEYVRYLVGIANGKMEANRKRTDGFFQVLQQQIPPEPTAVDAAANQEMEAGQLTKKVH